MKVGFIGLGIMGAPMAEKLLAGGHTLYAHTRHQVPAALLQQGAIACGDPQQVADEADVIFIMVPDTPQVEEVLFGERGCAAGKLNGKVVVDMSSISPLETKRFAQRINQLGAQYLDAPVSGGEVGAKQGTLTIMVGGEEATFERVQPLLALMGKNITLIGGNGDGQTCKVANQIIVALTIEAVSEALVFASRAGADPARVREALMGGFASSRILEVHGERMIKRALRQGSASRCTRRILIWRCRARRRWRSACRIPPLARSCSTSAPPMATANWITPRWCGRWRSWATTGWPAKSTPGI